MITRQQSKNPSKTKRKLIGAYLTRYRTGTGYRHQAEQPMPDSVLEHKYWDGPNPAARMPNSYR